MARMKAGAGSGVGRAEKAKIPGFKKGGAVHSDAAQDKKMIDAAFAKRGMKRGGKVKGC